MRLVFEKKINKILIKLFYTILYISLGCVVVYLINNNSFWLIHHGNAGFVGEKVIILFIDIYQLLKKIYQK